jgi:hypothetical protein
MSTTNPAWFLGNKADEFCCGWCKNVVVKPVNWMCGHMNCFQCVTKHANSCAQCGTEVDGSESDINFWLASKIAELQIMCPNPTCGKFVTFGEGGSGLNIHYSECGYIPKPCTHCGEEMAESNIAKHEKECKKRPIPCMLCEELVLAENLQDHNNSMKYPLGCAGMQHCIHGCITKVSEESSRKKQKRHRKSKDSDIPSFSSSLALIIASQPAVELGHRDIHTKFPKSQQAIHDEVCPMKKLECKICGLIYLRRDEFKHYTENIVLHMNAMHDQKIMNTMHNVSGSTESMLLTNFSTLWKHNSDTSYLADINRVITIKVHRKEDSPFIHISLTPSALRSCPFTVNCRILLARSDELDFDRYNGGHLITSKNVTFTSNQALTVPEFVLKPDIILHSKFYNVSKDAIMVHFFVNILSS